MGPSGGRGGINPIQVGTGSALGSIDTLHTQGFRETTDNPLDLQIEGDGYFVVETPTGDAYTRAGNFYLDEDNYVVNIDGYYVLDTAGERIQIEEAKSISVEKDGTITVVLDDNSTDVAGQ